MTERPERGHRRAETLSLAPKPATVSIRLKHNYWPTDGRGKTAAGSIIEVSREEAREIIEKRVGERANPVDI